LYALTLPDTPPKGAEAGGDVFGLSALKLLKESSFLIFIVCLFLACTPACGYFFALQVPMLQQRGFPSPLALTSLCQFAEIIFMFTMPWFVARLGLKWVIAVGMAAWAIRYLCFMSPEFPLALLGLVLHGFCYSFLYVGAYMYVDRRAPEDLKASAQSLVAFLLLGVGFLLGAKGAGLMMDKFPADVPTMTATVGDTNAKDEKAPLPRWDDPNAETSAWRYLDLSGTLKNLLPKTEEEGDQEDAPKLDLAQQLDADKDGTITVAEIEAFEGSTVTVDGFNYAKADLTAIFEKAHKTLGLEGEVALNRTQWLEVQSNKWKPIWLYPSIGLFAILAFFALAFRDKPDEEAPSDSPDEASDAP
jgi:hypothetical protein